MKIKPFLNLFLMASLLIFCVACKSNLLPNVSQPTYSMYSFGDERGYKVQFSLPENAEKPTAVVINKIKQPITEDTRHGNTYKLNVISQSRRIFGFKPEIVDRENGIFFKTENGEAFKPVKFKLADK